MSDWNDASTFENTPRQVNLNLNQLPTVSDQVAVSSGGSVLQKVAIGVISTTVVVLLIGAVMIPVELALTHKGPFATIATTAGTSSANSVTTTAATTTGSTTVVTTASTTVVTTASTTVVTTASTTVVTTASTTVVTTASTTVVTTASTTVATTTSAPQCFSYTTISDATRLASAGSGSGCDSSLFSSSVTWVRFTSPGGTQISTSVVSINQCGTQATGWYNGSLPSSGVTTSGTVCYSWSSSNCNWLNWIQVTNCGAFYVFGLIAPPVCNLRYCTV